MIHSTQDWKATTRYTGLQGRKEDKDEEQIRKPIKKNSKIKNAY